MTKGKTDPTLSGSLELLTLPSSTLASWGAKEHRDWGKPPRWEVAGQASQSSKQWLGQGVGGYTQSQGRHIHISIFIY